MIAVDTNILVRWITRDDPDQAAIADRILSEPVLVCHTVLLELAWVLGGKSYAFDRSTQVAALRTLVALQTVTIVDEARVDWAIDRLEAGADFADMLHLQNSREATAFLSFEKQLADKAGADAPLPIARAV